MTVLEDLSDDDPRDDDLRHDHLSDDDLRDAICTWAGRVAAGTARLLALVGECDRREAWAGPGLLSCAHWLAWRVGLSPGTAREWVRVARRLPELPEVQRAFAAGRMSWSQVRAVTRVAEPDDGVDWPVLARSTTASQLERLVRGLRRARAVDEAAVDPELARWRRRTRERWDDEGNLVLTITVPAEHAATVRAGLAAQRAALERQRADTPRQPATDVPAGTPDGPGADPEPVTDADALVALAGLALDEQRREHPSAARAARAQTTLQVDPLSGWARARDGELLPPTSLTAVLRALPGRGGVRLRPLTAADLRLRDLGRRQRLVSPALRDLLGVVDGECCRFPGCTRRRGLDAHHVVWWSRGGPTDLANLLLLCGRHHTLVHEQGFRLELRPDRTLRVATADGVPVLRLPALPVGDAEALPAAITARTLPPDTVERRMDLRHVVWVLMQQAA